LLQYEIYALHGFLGRGIDWTLLENTFQKKQIQTVDIFSERYSALSMDLKVWAKTFNHSVSVSQSNRILMGYSLGGRLALHVLIDDPAQWSAAILISTSPGLKTMKERKQRLMNDKKWAKKFLSGSWEKLIEEWNNQAIFNGESFPFERREADFSRVKLAEVLEKWSLGLQDDLSAPLSLLPQPILWIVGENDKKHTEIAKTITLTNPKSEIWIVPEAGHRLVWQQSVHFLDKVNFFLNGVS
jgi:2-succinyl-6-hydroxy-2,4-cyclohexadiene-1-carboxylate synthase